MGARAYDPEIGRFISADSIVPDGEKASIIPLTVDFHEPQFLAQLNAENRYTLEHGFWFQLSAEEKREAKVQRGPLNPQALNRFSYVLGNPLRYTDPTGHEAYCTNNYSYCTGGTVVNSSTHTILVRGDWLDKDGNVHENAILRLHPGQSSRSVGMIDVDEIMVDQDPIDGQTNANWFRVGDGDVIDVSNDASGNAVTGRWWVQWPRSGAGQGYYVIPDDEVESDSADLYLTHFPTDGLAAAWARWGWGSTTVDCVVAGRCTYTRPAPYEKR